MMISLIFKTWRDHWKSLISWAGVIVAMTSIQLSVYPSIVKTGDAAKQFIDAYPEAFKKMFRMEDYTSGPGFLSTELFSLMLPLVLIAVGATWGASATAEEEEKGTADLLFTLPISRLKVLASKMIATFSVLIFLGVVIYVNLYIGSGIVDLKVNFNYILAAILSSIALGLFFSGLGFLIGSISGKKSVSLGSASAIGLLSFVFYSLAPLVDNFDFLNPINPFEWAIGGNILFDGPDWTGFSKLLLGTFVLYITAALVFKNKDIHT
jgi:ABC-2 type transport system permease protein